MIWSISWKNIWRNKLRSLIVVIAITLGLLAGVFSSALMNGIIERRIRAAIENEVSHIQIHNKNFMENIEIGYNINNANEILDKLASFPEVKHVSKRMKITAMANTPSQGTGVNLIGVYPEKEKQVSSLYKYINDSSGTYFDAKKKNSIVVSQKFADKLNLNLRSKVVLTFVGTDGTLTGAAFKVVGIFKTSNSAFDEMNAFVRFDDLARLTNFDTSSAHEIAILLNDKNQTNEVAAKIASAFPQQSTMTWLELQPDLGMIAEFLNLWLYVFVIIILLALGFGIVNTMLMAVLERVKELGMLMAVGMNKKRVFSMIMLETIFLTLTGGALGMLVGAVVVYVTGETGIDFSAYAEGFSAIGYESIVYPTIGIDYYLGVTSLVIITGVFASIYPARKALKLNPSEAIRTEM
ncbi:MAG: ABC transporter permease [Marinilabiliales bacterium]|nr:MAG: ABC transporter permease [Marinilabiliales bacterium]